MLKHNIPQEYYTLPPKKEKNFVLQKFFKIGEKKKSQNLGLRNILKKKTFFFRKKKKKYFCQSNFLIQIYKFSIN